MKKLFTILSMSVMMICGEAFADRYNAVCVNALRDALMGQYADIILDKDAFVNRLVGHPGGMVTVYDVAEACLEYADVANPDVRVNGCRDFVYEVVELHNQWVDVINDGVIQYAMDGFRSANGTKQAQTSDRKYYVAYIDWTRVGDFTDAEYFKPDTSLAVFDASNDVAVCVLGELDGHDGVSRKCKPTADSEMVFVYKNSVNGALPALRVVPVADALAEGAPIAYDAFVGLLPPCLGEHECFLLFDMARDFWGLNVREEKELLLSVFVSNALQDMFPGVLFPLCEPELCVIQRAVAGAESEFSVSVRYAGTNISLDLPAHMSHREFLRDLTNVSFDDWVKRDLDL